MLDDSDHDHDARANGDRPPRAVCIHDPLAVTPADAPRREILAALAEAESSDPEPTARLGNPLLIAAEEIARLRALCDRRGAEPDYVVAPLMANALPRLLDALEAERARVTMLLDRCAVLEAALLERV